MHKKGNLSEPTSWKFPHLHYSAIVKEALSTNAELSHELNEAIFLNYRINVSKQVCQYSKDFHLSTRTIKKNSFWPSGPKNQTCLCFWAYICFFYWLLFLIQLKFCLMFCLNKRQHGIKMMLVNKARKLVIAGDTSLEQYSICFDKLK